MKLQMKFIIHILTFCLLSLNCKNEPVQQDALNFFPVSKSDLLKEGFQLERGAIKEQYKKAYGDTTVYFHYPTEASKYHKLIQFKWPQIDTTTFLSFVKKKQSATDPKFIILVDKNGNERPHIVNITKRYASIIFIHPDYEIYRANIDTVDKAPQAIEN